MTTRYSMIGAAALALAASALAADPEPVDLSTPTLYVVGYSHLDTQWRWTFVDTIREFIPNTLLDNFELFEKHPEYVFNFGGSRRYRMMQEYFPADFERLKGYVASGQWFPCGSSVDENDANVPSAESQIRHALYGNRYFREEFGIASDEFMLPDCFGFPASLPSVLAHCGIRGFSTQKLTWNAVVPIPFKVGVWEGPDGRSVIAALDPGAYVGRVRENLAMDDGWHARIMNSGDASGVYVDYHYYGTGDQGGAPDAASVAMVMQSIATGRTPEARTRVIAERADAMFNAITDDLRAKLPRYAGELELTQHSAGSVTSQSTMKRWNRKNELLADAAEKASVGAWLLGSGSYPAARLQEAWELVLVSQMHDILPGTSVPKAYEYSWNDEVIAANQFGAVLTDAARAVISKMDTRIKGGTGQSVVVFNPLSWEREEVVEVGIPLRVLEGASTLSVWGPTGELEPWQWLGMDEGKLHIAFLAKAPPVGFAAYRVGPSGGNEGIAQTGVSVTDDGHRLENEVYIVTLNDHGDVVSIFDKRVGKEMLSGPVRLGLYYENPSQWPAWNQDWGDRQKPATSFAGESGPVSIQVVEKGPARVAVMVTREAEGSTFTQWIRLGSGGAADRIEFATAIDWQTRQRSLRAVFPLAASNPIATYDIQVGAIERGNGHPVQYEYGFHHWFDLTDASGEFGASIACDSRYGADKPDDNTVRLTLLFTPGTRGGYPDQGSQDLGRHHVMYTFQSHAGDWRESEAFVHGARVNQPLMAFATTPHEGPLGKSYSIASVSDPTVSISALKKAEDSDEIVVRLREHTGRDAEDVRIGIGDGRRITSAREIDGQERQIADGAGTKFAVRDGTLFADIGAFELRAFALTVEEVPAELRIAPIRSTPVALPYNVDVVSTNADRTEGAMTATGETYPGEQFPKTLEVDGIVYEFGGTADGQLNAVRCQGQEIALPPGDRNRISILAAATSKDDADVEFTIGSFQYPARVHPWTGYVGQWDNRQWPGDTTDPNYPWGSTDITGLTPGYIKQGEIAWYCSHHHAPRPDRYLPGDATTSDVIYEYCYLFKLDFALPPGKTSIRLPDNENITVFAISTVHDEAAPVEAAYPLFDTLAGRAEGPPRIEVDGEITAADGIHADTVMVSIDPGLYWQAGAFRYTTDGTDPRADSAVYDGPITVHATATISAAAVESDGSIGPVSRRTIDVHDTTPPRITHVQGVYQTPILRVDFSEPVAPSAADASLYAVEPGLAVTRAVISEDQRSVTLTLASAPAVGETYSLRVSGVRDNAPGGNAIAQAPIEFTVAGPVFAMETIDEGDKGKSIHDVPGLPVVGTDPWTLNLFVKMDKQPINHTVLAGFGKCADRVVGGARYLCKFAGGVHFWSSNQDVPSRTPYDLDRWQMVTAAYDGETLRLYKDAVLIGERGIHLADEENVINIAPVDPWDHRYRFDGELAGLTIWNSALGVEALEALLATRPR